jgi:hypothetical protein
MPSQASTPKLRPTLKHTLQDIFAEGSAKENQILEHLGTQKHKHAIGELELKCRKLDHKVMEKQHQCEHEQHEFHIMQMQMIMSQNQPLAMMQSQNQSFEGLGLMANLNDAMLPSESTLLNSFSV